MQKATYIIFVPLLIVQAFTGLALLTFTIPFTSRSRTSAMRASRRGTFWSAGGSASWVGSIDLAGWYTRTAHYFINWLFIVLTTIHVYLSVTEDFPAFLDFFGLGGAEHHDENEEARCRPRIRGIASFGWN